MSLPGVLQVPERKSLSLIYPFFLSTPGSSPNKTKTQPFVVFRELKATSQSPDQTDAQLANYKGLELHLIRRRALEKRRNLVLGSVWVDTDFWTCSSLFQDKIAGNCLDISPEDVGLSPLNPLVIFQWPFLGVPRFQIDTHIISSGSILSDWSPHFS